MAIALKDLLEQIARDAVLAQSAMKEGAASFFRSLFTKNGLFGSCR